MSRERNPQPPADPLAGPRALTFGCLGGIVFWAIVLFVICVGSSLAQRLYIPTVAHGAGPQYQACAYQPQFPVRIRIDSSVDTGAWRAAIAEWDAHYPGTFVEVTGPAKATITATTGQMWVRMGMCLGGDTIVYANADQPYWYAHELGHVLGLRDWLRSPDSDAGYINPGRCPGEYDGIMSYCTPRERWFGPGDDRMMASLRGR